MITRPLTDPPQLSSPCGRNGSHLPLFSVLSAAVPSALASLALGGTAIWVTHFSAMLGFTVPGAEIRYDPVLTSASLVLAVAVAAVGLAQALRERSY